MPWETTKTGLAELLSSDHQGSFSEHPEFDIRGGDSYSMAAQFGADSIVNRVIAPFVALTRGSNLVQGYASDAKPVSLSLESHSGTVRASARVTPVLGSEVIASLQNDAGRAVQPRPGETLTTSIAPDSTLLVPVVGVHANPVTDAVHGRCMPDSQYELTVQSDLFDPDSDFGFLILYGRTGHDGTFSKHIGDRMNVKSGDSLALVCRYASGDEYLVGDEVQ